MENDSSQSRGSKAEIFEVSVNQVGQRIDNFLIRHMKGVPKSRLYRAIRSGEVRVNGSRKKAPYQLCVGDKIRIPPIRQSSSGDGPSIPDSLLEKIPLLFEDDHMMVVDKPARLAVHGGSGLDFGLIEALRKLRPELPYLELVHRLDRDTSGCLMLAKSRQSLLALQAQLGTERSIRKNYVALVKGAWQDGSRKITIRLTQQDRPGSRKRMVAHEQGLVANSIFSPRLALGHCSFMGIRLLTGRMHQARAHACSIGHPIAGDQLYGNHDFNRVMKNFGLKRLFLHAQRLQLIHPVTGVPLEVYSALPDALAKVLEKLGRDRGTTNA